MPSFSFPGITGWPALPNDSRGFRVRVGGGTQTDPDTSQRWIDPSNFTRPRQFIMDRFPLLIDAPLLETRSCHYELTVTRNFYIDTHPEWSQDGRTIYFRATGPDGVDGLYAIPSAGGSPRRVVSFDDPRLRVGGPAVTIGNGLFYLPVAEMESDIYTMQVTRR